MIVKIKLNGGIMPKKAHPSDAAFDLYVPEDVVLQHGRQIIDLKFSIELPIGYAATIQPRSGFSSKGIEVEEHFCLFEGCKEDISIERINGDVLRGLVDSGYRGNVGVILNIVHMGCGYTDEYYHVLKKGTRIAQMQIVEVPQVELVEAEQLSDADRGEGGFGHTGAR
jgi:dUTP pyrophosphatase